MTGERPLLDPAGFLALEGMAHLCAGGEAPILRSHVDAANRFFADKGDGMAGRDRMLARVDAVKAKVGRFLRLEADEIAFLLNSSDGMSVAAAGLETRPGDNVVVARSDFVSLALALQQLSARGVEIRYAGAEVVPDMAEFASLVDGRTRAIAVSQVSHLTGMRVDLGDMRALADAVGARLLVDASHALGAVPVDGRLCDLVVSCCYKWQLGVHGVGIMGINARRWPDLRPLTLGWHSVGSHEDWRNKEHLEVQATAERFETGNPPFINLYLLEAGLDALSTVSEADRASHVETLGAAMRDRLAGLGLTVVTPVEQPRRAGNVSFLTDNPLEIVARLRAAHIHVWGGEGRVRFSTHVYNSLADVDRAADVLASVL